MTTQEEKNFVYDESWDLHLLSLAVAIVASVIIHIVVVLVAGNSEIKFMQGITTTPEQKLALRAESAFQVKTLEVDPQTEVHKTQEKNTRPYDIKTEDMFLSVPTATPGAVFEPPAAAAELKTGDGAEVRAPMVAENVNSVTPWQPREEVLTVVDKVVYDDVVPYERRDVPDIERKLFTPDVAIPYEIGAALKGASSVGTPAYVAPAPPQVNDAAMAETLEGGEARMPDSVEAGPIASGEKAAEFFKELPADVAPAKPIENVLKTTVTVYAPRKPDGYTYFRVDVERKTETVLPVIPRDILLVQDASASLSMERLHFCQEAFHGIINGLKPTDRFNVIKFNTANTYCFDKTWKSPDPATRQQATAFVDAIQSEGNTDIYNAVHGVLDMPRSNERVMIVILASDGRATAGDIRRDSEIIGQFSKLNDGKVSVFDIGVSKSSNEFLLSMLSFCNRGGAAAIASDRFEIKKTVEGLYSTIGNPVLSDIRFMFDTASRANVSPAMTTHLYLDRPMQLFGRVPDTIKEVSFQARGLSNGKKYDMVFTLDLEAAENGDKTLITKCATEQMYDYVSEYSRATSSKLIYEMDKLGREYDITIPFKERLF